MDRWPLALPSALAAVALAFAAPAGAEAKRTCPAVGRTVAKLGATRVFATHHAYYACRSGRSRFLWSGRHTPDEEISFAEPRAAGRWVAFVNYYCTPANGHHVAHVVRVDLRSGRRARFPALDAPRQAHVRPRVPVLTLGAGGALAWTAELGAVVERHSTA
jgi:hypothetical protein